MHKNYTFSFDKDGEKKHEYAVEVEGLFMYRSNRTSEGSITNFITEYYKKKVDYNECYGAYRIHITNTDGEEVFFADNSGMMRYYINHTNKRIASSLSEAEEFNKREPNYPAIAQFLSFGCTYNNETIVKTVIVSNPNLWYMIKNNEIYEFDKDLKSIEEYKIEKPSLEKFIKQAASHADGAIGCTITGGIDSRSVLANLLKTGIKPDLAITGHDGQIDVEIAKEVSNTTGLQLRIVSDEIEEKDWFENAVKAADGQEGICGIYRLNKLARQLESSGIKLQFGGVAGELYKNSFINQDFPFYFGKPNWKRFYKMKVATFEIPRSLYGNNLAEAMDDLPNKMMKWLTNHQGRNKAEAYLNAGYEIMQARCNLVVNMFENHTTSYNPLMERKMASFAFGMNPYSLEVQSFQRREVSEKYPGIKNIKTDRNLTCNYNRRSVEFLESYIYLVKVAIQRLLFRNNIDIRVDKCFSVGLKNNSYNQAFENVKQLGILKNETDAEEVPVGLADRLYTVGMFFS